MKKYTLFFSLLFFAMLLMASAGASNAARQALLLCGRVIIPSLFPLYVVITLLNKLGLADKLAHILARPAAKLFGISGAGASALIVGLTGGYPLGAAYTAQMYEKGLIDEKEAGRLLGFCNNSGPAFIIGAVGVGVFSSVRVGLILYGVHIFSALIVGLILREAGAKPAVRLENQPTPNFSAAFTQSVNAAVNAMLGICGFVVFFSVCIVVLDDFGFISAFCCVMSRYSGFGEDFFRALLTGIVELGSGVGAMQGMSVSPINAALAAFLLGFGGISVQCQTDTVLSNAKIKDTLHFAGHLMSGSISAVAAYIVFLIRS